MAVIGIEELRVYWGTTFNTAHIVPSNDAWAISNAAKLRIASIDRSGLTWPGIKDATLKGRLHAADPVFPGVRKGALKVGAYLTGGTNSATVAADAVTECLGRLMGQYTNVVAKQYAIQTTGTTTSNIVANGISTGVVAGQGVLFPATGEARVASQVGANHLVLNMALLSIPTGNVVVGHTAYFDESAPMQYMDWLSITKASQAQWQGIGGQGKFGIKGLAPGEPPTVDLEIHCADHQMVTASLATATPHVAPSGGDPPTSKYQGGFYLANAQTSASVAVARTPLRAGEYAIDPGIAIAEREDKNGINGIGGWIRTPSTPTMEMTLAQEQTAIEADFWASFDAGTPKLVMLQLGTQIGACALIHAPRFLLSEAPIEKKLGNEMGLHIKGQCSDAYGGVSNSDVLSSAISITTF